MLTFFNIPLVTGQSLNQPLTVTFVPEQIITWLIIGLIAGVLASVLVRGRRFGVVSSIIIGLIGAIIGGLIFTALRIPVPSSLASGITIRWIDILVAFAGAVLILILSSAFYRRRV